MSVHATDSIYHRTNEAALPLFVAGTLIVVLARTPIANYCHQLAGPHQRTGENAALLEGQGNRNPVPALPWYGQEEERAENEPKRECDRVNGLFR